MSDLAQRLWRRYYRSPGVAQDHRLAARFDRRANFAGRRLPLLDSVQRRWTIGEWSPGGGVQLRYRALPAGEAGRESGMDAALKYPNPDEPPVSGDTGDAIPRAQFEDRAIQRAGSYAPNEMGGPGQPGGDQVARLTHPTGGPLVVARKLNKQAPPPLEASRFEAPAGSQTDPGIMSEKPLSTAARWVNGLKTEPPGVITPERAFDQHTDHVSYPADVPAGFVDRSDGQTGAPVELDRFAQPAGQPVTMRPETSKPLWLSRQVDRGSETPPGMIRGEEPAESLAGRMTYGPDGLRRLAWSAEYPARQAAALNRVHRAGTDSVQRSAYGPLPRLAAFDGLRKPGPLPSNGLADEPERSQGSRAIHSPVAPEKLPLSRPGPTIARTLGSENSPVRQTLQEPQETIQPEAGSEIDLEGLAEQVWRILERRLAVERERRGIGR